MKLEEAEFFRSLTPDRLDRLQGVLRERRFSRQRVLYFEGHPAEYLWVLRRGEVRLYKSSPNGRIATLETLGPGQMFGALPAIDGDEYPASAEALTDGLAWCLPRRVLFGLVKDHPELAVEILGVVSHRLRDAHERLRSFAHDSAATRLARAILRAAHEGQARVTRRALGEASGTTVETAIRVLRRFEQEGLIRGEVGHVYVLDTARLRKIAAARPEGHPAQRPEDG